MTILGVLCWNPASIYKNDGTFFNHIISINPNARGAHNDLGNHLNKEEKYDEALKLYQGVLKINPKDAPAHVGAAEMLTKLNRYEEALQYFEVAIELDSTLENARTNRDILRDHLQRDHIQKEKANN